MELSKEMLDKAEAFIESIKNSGMVSNSQYSENMHLKEWFDVALAILNLIEAYKKDDATETKE